MRAKPFLKWCGGKAHLAPLIASLMPKKINTYYEPCLGGGAVFFELAAQKRFKSAVLSDSNPRLIASYSEIRDAINSVCDEISDLAGPVDSHRYEETRELFNDPDRGCLLAPLLIFLNKTCFNGLYRENSKGDFNSPKGDASKFVPDLANIRAVSAALQGVELFHKSLLQAARSASKGDAVYIDPPYFPTSDTANFTAYDKAGFSHADQLETAAVFSRLARRGVTVIASNADTPAARALYEHIPGATILSVSRRGTINSDPEKRGRVWEILVVANRRR